MGKAIPTQHPAVVLRSHYRQLRALLAVAMIAVVGLTAAVVILAINNDGAAVTSAAPPAQASAPSPTGSIRYDGGPEEGTSGALSSGTDSNAVAGIRYDGGPEEGTAAITPHSAPATLDFDSIKRQPGVRYDGGPEEGTSGALSSGADSNATPGIRYDGGPEEGSSGIGH